MRPLNRTRANCARLLSAGKPALLAAGGEEIAEEGGAFGAEDAFDDFDAVIEQVAIGDLELAAYAAEAEVAGAEDEAAQAGVHDGAGAHDTGFERAIEIGALEAVIAKAAGGSAQGEDFGVGGGIAVRDGRVGAAADDFAVEDDDGADRHFVAGTTRGSQSQGFTHISFV